MRTTLAITLVLTCIISSIARTCPGLLELTDPLAVDIKYFDETQMAYLKKYKIHFVQVNDHTIKQYFYNDSFTLDSVKYWDNLKKPIYFGTEYFKYNTNNQLVHHSVNEHGPYGLISQSINTITYQNTIIQSSLRMLSQWEDTRSNSQIYKDTSFFVDLVQHVDTISIYKYESNIILNISQLLYYRNGSLYKKESKDQTVSSERINQEDGYEVRISSKEELFYALPSRKKYNKSGQLLYTSLHTSGKPYLINEYNYNEDNQLIRIERFESCRTSYLLRNFIRNTENGSIKHEITNYFTGPRFEKKLITYSIKYKYSKEIPK